ncbi:ribonuclease R [Psychrosphaera saromensis]|uniref:Ribonuclease R n=1 Tax=Psychrosphaera saromensis TaxID=716813 RepID=A0A2S7USY5_9GAMM|nr:ribonuclease R [Psychrosphaera saromensis]PQJ52391.1 ribonuclease R [Psychrosphaera saromensis]GHB73369.1 ribonuclease R [Psychrosphaera saromensis]GLQ13442.1 ribonuclease R [Psychrosphaera saromensis]
MPKHDPNFSREQEKYDTPIASREFILEQIVKNGGPLGFGELVKLCHIPNEDLKVALKRRLRAMEREGQLLYNRHNKYEIPLESDFVTGKVIGHRDGFGFLQLEGTRPGKNDWYISHSQMRKLFHGDVVKAQEIGEHKGKTEARVVKVLEPRTAPIIGRYFVEMGVQVVIPDDSRIKQEIIIPQGEELGARHGQMAVVELVTRPDKRSSGIGKVVEVLGEHMAPGVEIEIALRNYEIPHEWPKEVSDFAENLSAEVTEQDKEGRVDLRKLPLVTIDGESSRDFDDAVYSEKLETGGWRLYVAIADVSHYVKHNSPMDKEAIERGNSVYFPDQVVPMLPEELSNGLCSLNPQVDRLCLVCEMTISASGELSEHKFYQAVMHSHARLTYTKVAAMLDGDEEQRERYQHVYPHIVDLFELYTQLKLVRAERGAFEFETIEAKFIFNAQRKIESVETVARNDAHKIIEECMILANVSAAQFIEQNNAEALFRVHDKPDPSKLAAFRSFIAELGGELTFGDEPTPKELSAQVNKYLSRPDGELIQTMMIRSMRQAVYQADNIGHFGLALEGYAHFTSPIRRYPDLIVHRAIKAIINKQGQKTSGHYAYNSEELEALGEQCSMTERRADEATRDVESWLKCEFMQDHIGSEHAGVISSVTSFGIFVRLLDLHIEGLVHITALGNDYYQYDGDRHVLVGERNRRVFRLGDKFDVRVKAVDLDEKQIDFELAELPTQGGRTNSGKANAGKGSRTRSKANEERTNNTATSIRDKLRKGDVPNTAKSDGSGKRGTGKSKTAESTDEKSPKRASRKKPVKSGKKKPKSRAGKRIAAKKTDSASSGKSAKK